MDKAPWVLIANPRVQRPGPAPRLRLLTELEPRHRVFMSNLADLLWAPRVPQVALTSRPARFWADVFVPTGAPWTSFLESILLHLLLIVLLVWAQSRIWVSVELFPRRAAVHKSITYYPPKQTFRAAEGRTSSAQSSSRVKQPSTHSAKPPAHQRAMPVTPEQKPSLVTPPDIKQATAKLPNLPGGRAVAPMVPFSATASMRRNALAATAGVVAPPPRVEQATGRHMEAPQASAVAPAPEIGVSSAGRAMNAPASTTGGVRVVPPPPSVQSAGSASGDARFRSLPGAGPSVVPPPPLVQGSGHTARDARLGAGTGPRVVPPPALVPSSSGREGGSRLGSLSGSGPDVVPPPPQVRALGNADREARSGSMTAADSQVVPPPPSVQSSSGPDGSGRLGALSGASPDAASPPPPVESAGNSGASGTGKILEPMDPLTVPESSPPAVNGDDKSTIEELPLGLIGVVFAAPGTSYFSNFEVFVAKRRVSKDKDKNKEQMELIKLVYEFLPYQKRLSEYDLRNLPPRVIKLRVTPDPSCDESLGQMMQSHAEASGPVPESAKLPAALNSFDLNAVLPCYRTTAGDFQKAMSRGR